MSSRKPGSTKRWAPQVGDVVWLNYPDTDKPEGKVIGFVPSDERRAGQPMIERLEDEPTTGLFTVGRKKGDVVVIAAEFLLPFMYGSGEWLAAKRDGLIDG